MELLSFTVPSQTDPDGLRLEPYPPQAITPALWQGLAAGIAAEGALMPHPAGWLAEHFYAGYAAVVVCEGQIVSYIAMPPIVQRAAGAHAWSLVLQAAGAAGEAPDCEVYEFSSAWTAPAWRGRRLSRRLQPTLIRRHLHAQALGLTGMVGLASPVLARLGWQIMAWQALPFVSSLIAVPPQDFPVQAAHGWQPPGNLPRYHGPHIPLEERSHCWEQYCYCWVSDPSLAAGLEQELALRLDHDLPRWQAAAVDVFCRPDSPHRLAFLA